MDNQKITALIDRQEILDLTALYRRALDRLDPELMRSLYFDDAEESRGFYEGGPDGFVDYAMNYLKTHDANQHMLGQSIIDIEGDVAYGEIYFMAFHRTTNRKGDKYDFWVGGRYIDRYEKRNDVWKIAFRSEINDWTSTHPESERAFFQKSPDAIRGGRGSNDMINQKEKFHKGE